jgi:hypothetical protein
MKTLRFAIIGLAAAAVGAGAWYVVSNRPQRPVIPSSALASADRPAGQQAQTPSLQGPAPNAPPQAPSPNTANEPVKHFGPFSIAGQNYTLDLETKGVHSTDENGDTVTAMEIRDAAGTVRYRRTFAAAEEPDYFESWSVSALLLKGMNGTGLLVNYDVYSEPSAPEEEPTSWFQVFGVLDGKLVSFGAPVEVQGGLLDEYTDGKAYKAARSLGNQADAFEFKVWTGHCRMAYPVRVDWAQGRLSPAQECVTTAGDLGPGCQYKVLPEDKLYNSDITFVRLWPGPNEKSGQPMKTVVKKDSKVELLTALVATQWTESKTADAAASSKGPSAEAGGFGVVADSDLWLKVRIDGKEGWMHSEEDFRALGLPEDE